MNTIKIMILDDEEMLLTNLRSFLEDEGCDVDVFLNAEDALTAVEADKYQAAVVDLRLREMDGFDFMKFASEKDPQLKFIIHTGSTQHLKNLENEILTDKVIGTFLKPVIRMQQLYERIFNYMEKQC